MFRSGIKKTISSMVQTVYTLGAGGACQNRVTELLQNVTYIYPTARVGFFLPSLPISYKSQDGALIRRTKPFFHPAIISTLQQVFAKNVAEKYSERFTSSIAAGPRQDEKEMPIAITAFTATCVRFFS